MPARHMDPKLLCRTLGHAWFVVPADKPSKYGDPMWFRCERCDTERHDDVSRGNGELFARQYVYADDYQKAFDERFDHTPMRADFRLMLFDEIIKSTQNRRSKKS